MITTSNLIDTFISLNEISMFHRVRFNSQEALEIPQLKEIIEEINSLIPLMNYPIGNNPNHGKPHHTFDIGKEYSTVIYVNVVKAYMPKDFSYDKLRSQIEKIAIKHYADEKDVIENTPSFFQMRIWWD